MALSLNNNAKRLIMKSLGELGYATYSKLLGLFDIYLTDDPEVVGYMIPKLAKIVLNKDLALEDVSTIVRHEMLHEWLTHSERALAYHEKHPNTPYIHDLLNIAADYEISNVGYTDKDKEIIRSIHLGDKILLGLVTEIDFPDWKDATFEEMYDSLLKMNDQQQKMLQNTIEALNKLDPEDLKDLEGNIQLAQEELEKLGQDSSKLDDLLKELNNIQDLVSSKELDNGRSIKDTLLDTSEELEDKKDLARRVIEIEKAFKDEIQRLGAKKEISSAKRKEKEAKIARAQDRINASPLQKFKLNLNSFIAYQLEEIEDETYSRINPSYEDSEFIMPGRKYIENKKIPTINVYHDVSGSFEDPAKTEGANKAISTLNKYVEDGDIIINRYYFADAVSSNKGSAGSGTNGTAVVRHILDTQPDNVIVITDEGIDSLESVTVPGAVWFLIYDNKEPLQFINSIKGKKQNRVYLIKY